VESILTIGSIDVPPPLEVYDNPISVISPLGGGMAFRVNLLA